MIDRRKGLPKLTKNRLLHTAFLSLPLLSATVAQVTPSTTGIQDQRGVNFDLSPDGTQIAFTANGSGARDIYILNCRSHRVHVVRKTGDFETDVAFSPDGKRIVFATAPPGNPTLHIALCSVDGTGYKDLTPSAQSSSVYPSFDASGTQIVFARSQASRPYAFGGVKRLDWDVYLLKDGFQRIHRVTSGHYDELSAPTFSPDAGSVAYAGRRVDADGAASAMNVEMCSVNGGGKSLFLTSTPHSPTGGASLPDTNTDPIFTPDGEHIIYVSDAGKAYDYQLYSMNVLTERATQLTHGPHFFTSRAVTPDGKRLLYLSDTQREGRFSLYECEIDGSGERLIADSTLFDDPLHWKSK